MIKATTIKIHSILHILWINDTTIAPLHLYPIRALTQDIPAIRLRRDRIFIHKPTSFKIALHLHPSRYR